MRFIILIIALLAAPAVFAGDKKYSVTELPDSLVQGAHVVKRSEDIRLEIVNSTKVVVKKSYAYTVLDEMGAQFAALDEYYDKLREVRSIEGWLYDAAGNELRRLKGKEIEDRSAISSISIWEDNRIKHHSFAAPSFPYTVVYQVEVAYHHSYYLDAWRPQEDEHVAVVESRFTVVSPAGYKLRHRQCNYNGTPVTSLQDGKQTTQWAVRGLKPLTRPFAAPVWNEMATVVYLAPSQFEIEGYKGEMSTWEDLGRFQAALNKGRDELPPAVMQEVARITAGMTSDRQKAEALYRYLQANTRYISIQLGIGGWQPFDASFVAQKGYGDCKALSNYMYALLKAAGIRSHYAIIRAGGSKEARAILEDFPMIQANHVILCVPLQGDSLWLECTSQTESPGYLGAFTGNRKALLVTENGGVLVATPRYGAAENLQLRTIRGKLDGSTGTLEASIETRYAAQQQEDKQALLEHATKEQVEKTLNQDLDLGTYDIRSYSFDQKQGSLPQIKESLELVVNRHASVSGKRLFILPNLLNRTGSPYTAEPERAVDFVFDFAYRDVDSAEIELPDGYTVELLPAQVSLKTAFGFFTSIVKVEGNKLVYYRVREQYAGRYKPLEAPKIAAYFAAIYKADHARVVLVKKE